VRASRNYHATAWRRQASQMWRPPLAGVSGSSSCWPRAVKCHLEERGEELADKSVDRFSSSRPRGEIFEAANRPSKALAAISVSLGNWTCLREENAAKRVELPSPWPCLLAITPAGRHRELPAALGSLFAEWHGERSVLGCRAS
jgi:hypothetical protein